MGTLSLPFSFVVQQFRHTGQISLAMVCRLTRSIEDKNAKT